MDIVLFLTFPGDVKLNVASLALASSLGRYGPWKSGYYQSPKNCRSLFPAMFPKGNRGYRDCRTEPAATTSKSAKWTINWVACGPGDGKRGDIW